jgi:hypothetical protein
LHNIQYERCPVICYNLLYFKFLLKPKMDYFYKGWFKEP